MSEPTLVVERHGALVVLRLNRPHKANALDSPLVDALIEHLQAVADAPDVEALVITGTGRFFCAGGDIAMLTNWHGLAEGERVEQFRHGQQVATLITGLSVPVIAAVNGPAFGAGFDLALTADFRVAASSAWFQSGFLSIGLVPDLGGTWLLPRVVGLARARSLVLANERIDAVTAAEWGIVSRVVADDRVLEEAIGLATEISRSSTRPALAAAKRALAAAARESFDESLARAAVDQSSLMATPEHRGRIRSLTAS